MLPLWADILIVCAIPLIVLAVIWKWGEDGPPDNGVVHTQEDGKQDGGSEPADKPPGGSDDVVLDDPAGMTLAA